MFCRNCGKEIGANERFCVYCGAPTQASPQPAQQNPQYGGAQPYGQQPAQGYAAYPGNQGGRPQQPRPQYAQAQYPGCYPPPVSPDPRLGQRSSEPGVLAYAIVYAAVCMFVILVGVLFGNLLFKNVPGAHVSRRISAVTGLPVAREVTSRILRSLLLIVPVTILGALIAALLGSVGSKGAKTAFSVLSAVLRCFVPVGLALLLALQFSLKWRLLPAAGGYVLPFLTLLLPVTGLLLRDAVAPREEEGMAGAFAAVLLSLGKHLGQIVSCAIAIEVLFVRPGLGNYFIQAAIMRDAAPALHVFLLTLIITQICGAVLSFLGQLLRKASPKSPLRAASGGKAPDKLSIILCAVLAGIVLLFIVLSFALYDKSNAMGLANKLAKPGGGHLFGTDGFGRDVFARVLVGTGVTLREALFACVIAAIVGGGLGVAAGFLPENVSRIATAALGKLGSLPVLLYVVFAGMCFGPSPLLLALAIGLLSWGGLAERTGNAIRRKRSDKQADVFLPVAEEFLFLFSMASLICMAVCFLGFGLNPPTPELGMLLSEGRNYIRNAPWLVKAPFWASFLILLLINAVQTVLCEKKRRAYADKQ